MPVRKSTKQFFDLETETRIHEKVTHSATVPNMECVRIVQLIFFVRSAPQSCLKLIAPQIYYGINIILKAYDVVYKYDCRAD